ncbi:MAG: hypothetical protein HPY54_01905 [Chthonomonadetes bacterium]|nr:hypothetical protein [Chthonomonadetes bacterium]
METRLLLLTHRYLDPATGRFLTRDPIGVEGGVNLYAYVGNNPPNGADTLGLQKKPTNPPKCPKGQTPVWITCYETKGKCAYTGKPPREPAQGQPGTCATFCPKYGKPTFPPGTIVEVPGYGRCRVEDCGAYYWPPKKEEADFAWLDVWKEDCSGFKTGWRCVKVIQSKAAY